MLTSSNTDFKLHAMSPVNYLIVSAILFCGCNNPDADKAAQKTAAPVTDTIPATKSPGQKEVFFKRVYFSKQDAEKILGEKAFLSDSSSTTKKDTLECKLAYTAYSKDSKKGKPVVIYFMIEQYAADSSAKSAYTAIKVANEKHEGVKIVHDMGDEAYFHSDGQNFYFILVRKANKMFRIKVNKITSHTSLIEFNRVSKQISDGL